MELFWIILQYLFPRDPVGHVREMLRAMMQFTLSRLEHPLCEAMLKIDGNRLCFETDIVGMEQMLADLIHFRACQIANVAWRRPPGARIYMAVHARSPEALLRRFEALARDFNRIEHLAGLRARRLLRMREQNPLNLKDHLAGITGLTSSTAPTTTARPDERRDPGLTMRLVPTSGCSPNSAHAGQPFLGPDFHRDERVGHESRGPPTPSTALRIST